ncbi:hypothetical protein ACH5RR_024791 [Cinchona calisaya]|uniref:J domain-containing protein n=1 Tax=Cinchona calisaya TaxID=153742 RepID=A0ABD2YYV8_9GENT
MISRTKAYHRELEAIREKENVEKMIMNEDYANARDRLRGARDLFPLEDFVPMQIVCDILSAASNHFPGCEIDYYWILHLGPSSTMFDIRHQYQKLKTLLQPLKNKFLGTDVALNLIQDAFSVLSDNSKRSAFDLQRSTVWENYESPLLEVSCCPELSGKVIEMPAQVSSDCENDSSANFQRRIEESLSMGMHLMSHKESGSSSTSHNSEGNVAEVKLDVNSLLKQHESILKADPSSSMGTIACQGFHQDFYNFDDDRKVANMEIGQIWATHFQSNDPKNRRCARITAKYMSTVIMIWLKPIPVTNEERRWCDAGLPVACGSFCLDMETGEQVSSISMFSYKCFWTTAVSRGQFDIYPKKGEVWAVYEDWDLDEWSYKPEAIKSCNYKLVETLSDFSKYTGLDCASLVKVRGFRNVFKRQTLEGISKTIHVFPSMLYILSHKVPAYRLTGEEIGGVVCGMMEVDQLALPNNMKEKPDDEVMLNLENSVHKPDEAIMAKTKNLYGSSYTCLEKDLHQIDPCRERTDLVSNELLNVIETGQVWAVYCRRDSMPRKYVRIHNVFSRSQVLVTLLEPELSMDLEIDWRQENLPITCGPFIVGGTIVSVETSQLAHQVKFEKTMSSYMIYPAAGEIWAMYQSWDCEWRLSDLENCQYWIVEVLSDFSQGDKIVVAKLGEVKGCFTFFLRQQLDGFELIRKISRTEILSFSHRIRFYNVPGIGYHGIPEVSWHLEPDDLPPKRTI